MGGFYFIDILILGMVAAFLVYRLRSVLGRRPTNEDHHGNPYGAQGTHSGAADQGRPAEKVVRLPDRGPVGEAGQPSHDEPSHDGADPLAAGLTEVQIADPSFNPRGFVQGARTAFGMIVEAYAKGDTATLRPLLSDDLFDAFGNAIRARIAEGETHETRIEHMKSSDIVDAKMDGRTALVTMKFVTDQINTVRDEQGELIDGDPNQTTEVVDVWTFARNTRADDPNWTLVETGTPG